MLNRGQISAIDHLNPSPLTAVSSIYQFPLDYCPDRTSNNSEIVITELDFLNLLCKSRYFRRGNHNTAKTVKGRDFPDSQNGHFHFEHPRSAVQNTETTINYVLASNEFYLTNRSPCVLQLRVGGAVTSFLYNVIKLQYWYIHTWGRASLLSPFSLTQYTTRY